MVKLICDLNGGDNSSLELCTEIEKFLDEHLDVSVLVIGNVNLKENERLKVIKTKEAITNYDDLMTALLEKKDASLNIAFDNILNYDGLISVGSTPALILKSMMSLKRFSSSRLPLASLLPVKDKMLCLLDCGANNECNKETLVDFAHLGAAYIKAYMSNPNPAVALLSNGKEKSKGDEVVRGAYEILEKSKLNFKGNVEGTDLLNGDIDVAVANGYIGNIAFKSIEGTAKTIIKQAYSLGASKEVMAKILAYYDFNNLGAALLLGVDKVILKAHGAATPSTIYHVLGQAYKLVKGNLIEIIKEEFK